MRKGPVLTALVLIVAAGSVLAVGPEDHVAPEATTCWGCHSPDVWEPPMVGPRLDEMHFEERDDGWWLVATVENPWTHDLRYVNAVLEGAGALAYRGEPQPVEESGSFAVTDGPGSQRSHDIATPEGAMALDITVTFDGVTPETLQATLLDGEGDQVDRTTMSGISGSMRFELTAHDLATRTGPWRVILERQNPGVVDYTVRGEAAAVPGTLLAHGTAADPNGTSTLEWPVDGVADVENLTTLTVYHDMYYDHKPGVDDDLAFGLFTQQAELGAFEGQPYFVEPIEPVEEEDEAFVPGPGVWVLPALLWAARRGPRPNH